MFVLWPDEKQLEKLENQRLLGIAAVQRIADEAHRERIHVEIVEDLKANGSNSYDDDVEAIAAGRIRHLTIQY